MTVSIAHILVCFNQSVIRITELAKRPKIKPEIKDNKKQINSKSYTI